MKSFRTRFRICGVTIPLCAALIPLLACAENWPQWRGPRLDGTSTEKNVPIHWSATSKHHASLVSANGLVYFLNDDGVMNVVRPGPEFERIAKNELGEKTFASPAISDGQLFLRGDSHLFCIGERGR